MSLTVVKSCHCSSTPCLERHSARAHSVYGTMRNSLHQCPCLTQNSGRLGLIPLVSNDCKLLKKPFEATGEEGEITDVVLTLDIKV